MTKPKQQKKSEPIQNSQIKNLLGQAQERWRQVRRSPLWSETRTQILMCYIGLMTLFVGVAIPSVYHILFQEVDRRLALGVEDEIKEFRANLVQSQPTDLPALNRFMDVYLSHDLVEENQYFLFLLDDRIARSSPPDLPPFLQPNSPLLTELLAINQPQRGRRSSEQPGIGQVLYKAEPIFIGTDRVGLFIVLQTTATEHQQVDRTIRTVLQVMLVILLLASIAAWLMSGQLLQPLRSMAVTARGITESDLSKRIDVTGTGELAEVANTFNDMMDRLQTAFTSQQDFINDASHELRTPITIIQGHLELMGEDPEEQAEVLTLVNGELDRMNRFVTDLLILAKAGRPDFIQPEAIELQPFTEELFHKAKVIADCECQLDEQGSGSVKLDRQRITQAVLNLVENANQHTPHDGLIAIGSSKSRKNIRFWVRDTGIGIAPADQKRIFERFARASSRIRRSEGAGLGLSIVQAIAKASGGRVELRSSPGQGSTFTLIIPLRHQGDSRSNS